MIKDLPPKDAMDRGLAAAGPRGRTGKPIRDLGGRQWGRAESAIRAHTRGLGRRARQITGISEGAGNAGRHQASRETSARHRGRVDPCFRPNPRTRERQAPAIARDRRILAAGRLALRPCESVKSRQKKRQTAGEDGRVHPGFDVETAVGAHGGNVTLLMGGSRRPASAQPFDRSL